LTDVIYVKLHVEFFIEFDYTQLCSWKKGFYWQYFSTFLFFWNRARSWKQVSRIFVRMPDQSKRALHTPESMIRKTQFSENPTITQDLLKTCFWLIILASEAPRHAHSSSLSASRRSPPWGGSPKAPKVTNSLPPWGESMGPTYWIWK